MSIHNLYESSDASISVNVEFKATRFVFGIAYTEAPFNRDVSMRLFMLHCAFICLSVTRFFLKDAPVEARPERGKRPDGSSATRHSGKKRRKRHSGKKRRKRR